MSDTLTPEERAAVDDARREHDAENGVSDMMDDVAAFARRRPALFIGGAFLIGLGVARFLKSSSESVAPSTSPTGFSSVDPMTSPTPAYGTSGGYGEAGY